MENKAIIVELNKNEAIVLTSKKKFIKLKRLPEYRIGKKIIFEKSDIIYMKKNVASFKNVSIIALLILIFLLSSYYMYSFLNQTNVYAYISVDTDSSYEFAVDYNFNIVNIRKMNDNDNLSVINEDIKYKNAMDVMSDIINNVQQTEYIKDNKYILFSILLNSKYKNFNINKSKYENRINDLVQKFMVLENNEWNSESESELIFLCVSPDNILQYNNDKTISVGRQYVLLEAKNKDIILTEEITNGNISNLLSEIVNDKVEKKTLAYQEVINVNKIEKFIKPTNGKDYIYIVNSDSTDYEDEDEKKENYSEDDEKETNYEDEKEETGYEGEDEKKESYNEDYEHERKENENEDRNKVHNNHEDNTNRIDKSNEIEDDESDEGESD